MPGRHRADRAQGRDGRDDLVVRREVYGRDSELEAIQVALQAGIAAPVVVVQGPAGIGKTAVWSASVQRAAQDGWFVVSAAPAEQEAAVPLASIADLMRPLAAFASELPDPQRHAVGVAFVERHDDGDLDERALAGAVRSLLEMAADRGPVLVAVDDIQWLDPPSERALSSALRRLLPSPRLAVLASQRTDQSDIGSTPLGLDRSVEHDRLLRIELPPLGPGALHHLIRTELGAVFPRPLLARLARECGGNPLYALELARAMLRLPALPRAADDLPVPGSLQSLVADHLARLPPESLEAVRIAALLTAPTLHDLAAAEIGPAALDPAEEGGLAVVTGDRVGFTHPVYASVVRAAMPGGVRRRLHARLASVATEFEEQARHLAQSAARPDDHVAATLDEAARRVRTRGAPELAADLYRQAADFTSRSAGSELEARRLARAQCQFDSGDVVAAAETLDAAMPDLTDRNRAATLVLRASVAWFRDDFAACEQAGRAALAAVGDDDRRLAGRINARLSTFARDPRQAIAYATRACELLDGRDDPEPLSYALFEVFATEVHLGKPPRPELLEQAMALEGPQPSWEASTIPAVWWKGLDEYDSARERLEAMLDRATAVGDELLLLDVLPQLADLEILAGRWDQAAAYAQTGVAGEAQAGTAPGSGSAWAAAFVDALRGELGSTAEAAAAGIERGFATGDPWYSRAYYRLAGFVALSDDRPADAAEAYQLLAASLDDTGYVEPTHIRFEPDWVEACVEAGDLHTATAALERLEARHERLARPWTTLGVARSRALIDAASGADPSAALSAIDEALASVPPDVAPFDRARCMMTAGRVHRRMKHKRAARAALLSATAEFERLGASVWATKARDELGRIGGRVAAPLELTDTETGVARLAAEGRTNRDIATALFISPKTVEANLARVYRKLSIRSRAELGAAMARRET